MSQRSNIDVYPAIPTGVSADQDRFNRAIVEILQKKEKDLLGDLDQLFSGTFGGISVIDNATTFSVSTTNTQISNFDTNDPSSNTTPDHTNDHVAIITTGKYYVSYFTVVENSAGASVVIHVVAYKNNGATALLPVHTHRTLSNLDKGLMGTGGFVTLAAGDTVELWAEGDVTKTITFSDIVLSVQKVG